MPIDWALRWFAMLIIFALTTFAFSSYASAHTNCADPPQGISAIQS